MKTMTADAIALNIILTARTPGEQSRKLAALRKQVEHMVGTTCPECGGHDVEDNGWAGTRDASFRCNDCGNGWDAAY